MKPLKQLARGERDQLAEVDEAAKAEVDAREAVTAEQKAAAAAMVGGTVVKTADGKDVILRTDHVEREVPTFEKAFEPKKEVDESDAYAQPVEQKARFEEWNLDAPAQPAPAADEQPAEPPPANQ